MKFGFKSYNSWDPLKKVLVGSTFKTDFFADLPDKKVADTLSKVNEETHEDLEQLVTILKGEGVETYRMPDTLLAPGGQTATSVNQFVEVGSQIPKPLHTPRDDFFVLGETFIYGKPFVRMNSNNWQMPWTGCEDYVQVFFDKDSPLCLGDRNSPSNMFFDGACIMRAGRDITMDVNASAGKVFQQDWLPKFNNINSTNFRAHTVGMGRHTDGVMKLLRPGLIISAQYIQNYHLTYPDWDVFYVPKPLDNPYVDAFKQMKRDRRERAKNYWIPTQEGNDALHQFIDLWFKDGVGSVFETNFDVNILSLDQDTIITCGKNSDVEKRLWNDYGIKTIVSPLRHRWFWDGGIHCVTSDLYREGTCEDYWPTRGDTFLNFEEEELINNGAKVRDEWRDINFT